MKQTNKESQTINCTVTSCKYNNGRKYKKYELEPIKNEYGKINEYKVIESKHKNLNSVEMVSDRTAGIVGRGAVSKMTKK